jgi:hypothetical protein
MTTTQRSQYITRDHILKLLSDDEVASVSAAETAARLTDGDEYLDLERLEGGVRQAPGTTAPMGRILAKKAVREDTWKRILAQLPTARSGA